MKLNKLSLSDQKLFNRYLNGCPQELAAFSFANIFIWRTLYTINWVIIRESLCIFFRDSVGCFMYLPPLAVSFDSEVIQQVFGIMDEVNKNRDISRIENIPQEQSEDYRVLGYLCREKYPDYLCLRSNLAQLEGNQFKSQRAACNYFIKHYDCDWSSLCLVDRKDCLDLFEAWVVERKAQGQDDVYCYMLEDSRKVLQEALASYKQLNLKGIVVRVDKKIKGFSFGCKLNSNTFCILYEITDLMVKGLAQFIFRQFSQELKEYKYLNIMDDSGLENLRKTKLSYKPARLIPAYIATRDDRKY
jgi:uncharacterized protein